MTDALPLRDVARARRPLGFGRWLAWLLTRAVTARLALAVVLNPNFEWPVVARWFTADSILRGLSVTLGLTVVAMLIGVALGLLLAIARLSDSRLAQVIAGLYI